jgi:hypothetical protein
MSITSEAMSLAGNKWKPRVFTATYLCASAIAMAGWCTALTLGAISLARWMFS